MHFYYSTSVHHIIHHGRDEEIDKLVKGHEGVTIYDESGNIKNELYDVLDLLAKHDVVLASGHLSPNETMDLMRAAVERKVNKRIVTHASIEFIGMPSELQEELARNGTWMEHCYVSCLLQKPVNLEQMAMQIKKVGIDSCILSTDFGSIRFPSPVEGMKSFLKGLLALGFTKDELRKMIVTNPEKLLLG